MRGKATPPQYPFGNPSPATLWEYFCRCEKTLDVGCVAIATNRKHQLDIEDTDISYAGEGIEEEWHCESQAFN